MMMMIQHSFSEYMEWFYGFVLNLKETKQKDHSLKKVKLTYQLNQQKKFLRLYSYQIPLMMII
jgi:hypothetical protein